ncbi:MAG: hypothetical protein A2X64_10980 [Ignavibacteria bacterium GWF2_33_9]|nr:MAG: hypothetical protein A2X64_10980 [Ignavibacteria bacterium GWF2_33_9]
MNIKKLNISILSAILAFIFAFTANAQIQMSKPEPAAPTQFVFPNFNTHILSNGLKVYFITEKEQPTISLRLMMPGGSNLDKDKIGLAEIATELMGKGADGKNSFAISSKLDGIGASVNVSAAQDYVVMSGSSLTKHFDVMFDEFCNILLRPDFPKDEFEKLIDQSKSAVKMRSAESGTLAALLSAIATYGPNHPYAAITTEKSLDAITMKDVEGYYKSVFMPNNATLAVTGYFDQQEIIKKLEKGLKKWNKGEKPNLDVPEPKPLARGIYFIPREGSKQTSVVVSGLTVPRSHKDYLATRLSAAELGGGFGSKLFRTLREKYSFTYSPFARATGNKFANRLYCGAEVKADKSDSSLVIILEQLESLYSDGVTIEELERVKSNVIGNYQMSFESADMVTSVIQNADFYGESIDFAKTLPERMDALTTMDVAKIGEKYLKPDRVWIAIVGNPELKEELAKLGYNIYEYTLDLEDAALANAVDPVDMTPKDLIDAYTKSIGGTEAVNAVKTLKIESKLTMLAQGQEIPGKILNLIKYPGQEYQSIETPVFQQYKWVNNDKAWTKAQNELTELSGEDLEKEIKSIGYPTLEASKMLDKGYKCEILGEKDGQIKMKVTNLNKETSTYYFDRKTNLLTKIESSQEGPRGPMQITFVFSDYEPFGSVKFPLTTVQTTPFFSVEASNLYTVNGEIDDASFAPSDK